MESSQAGDPAALRARDTRRERLDEDRAHVFGLRDYVRALRGERSYSENGHNGVILVKTPDFRMLVEVVAAGDGLATHVVRGPATIHVLEGLLELETTSGSFRVSAGDMAVLPRDEPRSVKALEESAFLLALSPFETEAPEGS